MKISTKGRYAITAMMDIAIHQNIGPITLADISQCQGISLSYLEQLFARLRKAGLVEGVRGPGGGYRLARPAQDISVVDILQAVDDKVQPNTPNRRKDRCLTEDMWSELSGRMYTFLKDINLAEFANRPEVQEIARQHNGYIGRLNSHGNRRSAA